MKPIAIYPLLLLIGLFLLSCSDSTSVGNETSPTSMNIDSFPIEDLSSDETASLLFMVEEEKLARDVYLTLNEQWNKNVFANIAKSEQTHIDAVIGLLERYEHSLPTTLDQVGSFENEELQALFTTLTEQGSITLTEALKVGALIEEVDIEDIDTLLASTVDNADIRYVYEQLRKGSENHLRAFVKNLSNLGINYDPQILELDIYLDIIDN